MYILQEYDGGFWSDIYKHDSFDYLKCMRSIMSQKYGTRSYRIIEVIDCV